MSHLTHWFQRVYPPAWSLALFFAGYGVLYWVNTVESPPQLLPVLFVGGGSAAYGAFRAFFFHPAQNPSYRAWLDTTPWNARKPLPFGPIHVVWQDVILLLALVLLVVHFWFEFGSSHIHTMVVPKRAWHYPVYFVLLPFFGANLFGLATIMPTTGRAGFGAAIMFGLACTARSLVIPEAVVASLFATYVVAQVGVRRSFADFPWSITRPAAAETLSHAALGRHERQAPVIGWPHAQLGPRRIGTLFGPGRAAASSLLISAWMYAVLAHFGPLLALDEVRPAVEKFWWAFRAFVWIIAAGRVLGYCANHLSPISLLGRIATGRLIIPGYDRVFVAPLCVLVVGHGLEFATKAMEFPPHVALPASVAVVSWLVLSLGPSWEEWHLTGSHRLMPW